MDAQKWIGCKIRKNFEGVLYSGEVTGVDREKGTKRWLCQVRYEDGDKEDMYLKEVKECLIGPAPVAKREAVTAPVSVSKGYGEDMDSDMPEFERDFFQRNACRVSGGKSFSPSKYPGKERSSYLYWLRRVSDNFYAMRSFCLAEDPDTVGARYITFRKTGILKKCISWMSASNLDRHAKDANIVDTVHPDLISPSDGTSILKGKSLLSSVNEKTECLFVFNQCKRSKAEADVVTAIEQCLRTASASLRCLSFLETTLKLSTFEAISSCKNLSGLIISTCDMSALTEVERGAVDRALANVLRRCNRLRWLQIESSRVFGDECWSALESGSCPLLQILWVDTIGSSGVPEGSMGYRVLTSAGSLLTRQLRLCMVNPDKDLKSQFESSSILSRKPNKRA
eukprot:g269.t1